MATTPQRYVILFDIASGGMGVVSVAQLRGDRGFRKTVAVKRIHTQLAKDRSFYDLLAREARLCSQLQDPGIVQVLELLQQDDELLLAMELVEGTSLKELMRALEGQGEHFPTAAAVRILSKCASALHAAHSATDETGEALGVIHRDISPQNILLSFRGSVKVTDFGIAKALAGDEVTRTDSVRGKPSYLAPEQSIGGTVDARADIWALGVVGYEMLTGQRLFKGRNDLETLHLLMEGEIPRIDAIRPDIPPTVADVIERCLSRDADGRYPTAHDLEQALDASLPEGKAAKREDLAELLERALPGAQESFTAQVRAALASVPKPVVRATPTLRPLRIAGMAALGFIAAFGGRAAVGYAFDGGEPIVTHIDVVPTPPRTAPVVEATVVAPDEVPVVVAPPVADDMASPEDGDMNALPPIEGRDRPRDRNRRRPPTLSPQAQVSAPVPLVAHEEARPQPPREEPRPQPTRVDPPRENPTPPPRDNNAFIEEFPL